MTEIVNGLTQVMTMIKSVFAGFFLDSEGFPLGFILAVVVAFGLVLTVVMGLIGFVRRHSGT